MAQRYAVQMTWGSKQACLVCSRAFGKSFLISPYMMSRAMLFPGSKIHIIAPTAVQAAETFKKMEDIATGNIASVLDTTSTFLENCVTQGKGVSPFSHAKNGSKVTLYNGSTIESLIGIAENIVGRSLPTLNLSNCWELPLGQSAAKPQRGTFND